MRTERGIKSSGLGRARGLAVLGGSMVVIARGIEGEECGPDDEKHGTAEQRQAWQDVCFGPVFALSLLLTPAPSTGITAGPTVFLRLVLRCSLTLDTFVLVVPFLHTKKLCGVMTLLVCKKRTYVSMLC